MSDIAERLTDLQEQYQESGDQNPELEKYVENKDEPIMYCVEWYEDGDRKHKGSLYSLKLSTARMMAGKKRKQGKIGVEITRMDENGDWVSLCH